MSSYTVGCKNCGHLYVGGGVDSKYNLLSDCVKCDGGPLISDNQTIAFKLGMYDTHAAYADGIYTIVKSGNYKYKFVGYDEIYEHDRYSGERIINLEWIYKGGPLKGEIHTSTRVQMGPSEPTSSTIVLHGSQPISTEASTSVSSSNKQQSKHQNFMEMAEVVARRSPDAETKVGAVLVSNKNGSVLSTGFNGFVRGGNDQKLPKTRPDKHRVILHSEKNVILNCARNGISTEDSTIYVTHSPCVNCLRDLFQAGVTKIVYKIEYSKSEFDLEDLNVVRCNIGEGLTELTVSVK